MQELTREQLYEMVWAEPIDRLAKKFDLSGRGLGKLCNRYEIPVPDRGYWRRKETGWNDPVPALPKVSDAGRILMNEPPPGPEPEPDPEIARQIDYEREHPIAIADQLRAPHSVVAGLRQQLLEEKVSDDGLLHVWKGPVKTRLSKANMLRALRILDTFLKAAVERGFRIFPADEKGPLQIQAFGEAYPILFEESTRQIDHVLTKAQEKDKAQGHSYYAPKWDYVPSGILTLAIQTWNSDGLTHRWSDRENRPLETRLNEIFIGMARLAIEVWRPERLRREEEARVRAEKERLYYRHRQRVETFEKYFSEWKAHRERVQFFDAAKITIQNAEADSERLARWQRWTTGYLTVTDPVEKLLHAVKTDIPEIEEKEFFNYAGLV